MMILRCTEATGKTGYGRFLGDWAKGLSYVRSRGTTARGGLVFRHADGRGPGGRAPGLPDRAVPGTPAGKGSRACRPYGQTHHPAGDGGQGDRTGAGRHAAEAGRRTVRRGRRRGPQPGQGVSRGRHGRVAARERDAGQAGRPAMRRDRDAGDTEAPRRRVEEPEPGNAVMREVAEVAGKDPGTGLRRLSDREGTLFVYVQWF